MSREERIKEIGEYVCGLSDDENVRLLLSYSLGRVLMKAAKSGDWRSAVKAEDASHIVDRLTAASLNEETWLDRRDAEGRPLKLMKFGNVEQIKAEADKAMARASTRARPVTLVEGDEELEASLDGSYHVVRLLTATALDRESAQMQHLACFTFPISEFAIPGRHSAFARSRV